MHNCIFTGHCIEEQPCNTSCPALAQTSYLLERNDIKMSSPVFKMSESELKKYYNVLSESAGKIATMVVSNGDFTNQAADALTYCAICENWRGSQLHCTVYNLKLGPYIDTLKKSWSFGDDNDTSDKVSQVKIWARDAKVLIISNLDFINFKDFPCQTLLSLLQSRAGSDLTTIVVSPPVTSLVGEGQFFARLTALLKKQKVGDTL